MSALPLAVTDLGTGTPVIILHGLFGRRRNWQAIQKRLAAELRIIAADLRNHGDSPWSAAMTYPAMAGDIAALIENLGSGPALVVGHSMGGKAAMRLALERPDLVAGLMVIDIAPVPYRHNYRPYIDAMRGVPLPSLKRRSEAEAFMMDVIPEPPIRAFLLQNLGQDGDVLKWQVNLEAIDRNMAGILDFPDAAGARYDGPCRLIAGGQSDYIDADGRAAAEVLFPAATHRVIDGAGHWVHAEQPAEIIAEISRFAAEVR